MKATASLLTACLMHSAVLATEAYAMELNSASFSGGKISRECACAGHGGQDVSPQLTITGVPSGTTHYAIIMDDPDAQPVAGKTWVHWNVVNIPAEHTTTAPGVTPPGEELINHNNRTRYAGMCPPNGTHTYRLGVFALRGPIDTGGASKPATLTLESFSLKYKDLILDQAQIEGDFP